MGDASALPPSPLATAEAATDPMPTDDNTDDGYLDAIVGAVIATVVLVLIAVAFVVIRYMFRHKGSYRTNEAKGSEYAQTADSALRGDPTLRDAVDPNQKEYFI